MRVALALVLSSFIVVACESPGGSGAGVIATCRNGVLDSGEICDGGNVGANTCQSAGYERGVLICNQACTNFDYSGCSGGGSDVVQSDTTSPNETVNPGDTTPGEVNGSNRAPTVLSLNSNVATLNPGDQVIISAVVTDPDGIDDLIGGSLVDPGTGRSYGSFATSAAEGSYAMTLSWDAIETVAAITTPAGGATRGFRAEFYDVAGAKATQVLNLTLRCESGDEALCSGVCADLSSDYYHCGSCDAQVPSGQQCVSGRPGCASPEAEVCPGEGCVALDEVSRCGGCDHDCYALAEAQSGVRTNSCSDVAGDKACIFTLEGVGTQLMQRQTCAEICVAKGFNCYDDGTGSGYAENTEPVYCDSDMSWMGSIGYAFCRCSLAAGETPGPVNGATTITEIQSSNASVSCSGTGDVPIGGETTFNGVVTVATFTINSGLNGFFVSDGTSSPYTGLLVRFPNTESWYYAVGDRLEIKGKHYEYYCQTQFAATAVRYLGTDNIHGPRTIAKNLAASELEKYEGMVVDIEDVNVLSITEFGDAETDAGVLIDEFVLGSLYSAPPEGSYYATITGVLTWNFERYRISPRMPSDY